jgi:hypothetical protein
MYKGSVYLPQEQEVGVAKGQFLMADRLFNAMKLPSGISLLEQERFLNHVLPFLLNTEFTQNSYNIYRCYIILSLIIVTDKMKSSLGTF